MKLIFTIHFEKNEIGVDLKGILDLLSLQTGLKDIRFENNCVSHHLFKIGVHIHIEDGQVYMWTGYYKKLNYLILSLLYCLEELGGVLEYPVLIPEWAKKTYEEAKNDIDFQYK